MNETNPLHLPATADRPPQESLKRFLPVYLSLAAEAGIEQFFVCCGQINVSFFRISGEITDFSLDRLSIEEGANQQLMRQLTQKVLTDICS